MEIRFVADDPSLPSDAAQLWPDVQRSNCSVALAAVHALLEARVPEELGSLTEDVTWRAVEQFYWPGRFQTVVEGNYQWFLDGAHNHMSIVKAAEWFIEVSRTQRQKSH